MTTDKASVDASKLREGERVVVECEAFDLRKSKADFDENEFSFAGVPLTWGYSTSMPKSPIRRRHLCPAT